MDPILDGLASLQLIPAMGLGWDMGLLLGLTIGLPVVALLLSPRVWSLPERDPDILDPCRTGRDIDAIRLERMLQSFDREAKCLIP
jgi:hypothetical protein